MRVAACADMPPCLMAGMHSAAFMSMPSACMLLPVPACLTDGIHALRSLHLYAFARMS